jgi:hypothetical protein
VVSVTPRPRFTPRKVPPVPIGQEAGWAPEPVWTERLEEKSFEAHPLQLSIAGTVFFIKDVLNASDTTLRPKNDSTF